MSMVASIPRRLGHIWIGPKPAPEQWMQTWPERHPDWEYTIYDNDFLTGYPFRLRHLINEYFWRGYYAGVQDMMRYEILYEFGGFMADADAICKHPIDELLTDPSKAYTVWDRFEDDPLRAVCPILACPPRHPFLKRVIDELAQLGPSDLRKPEVSTGNRFLGRLLREHDPDQKSVTIWPMHYFLPWHKSDPGKYYDGPDQVYAEQQYGTSLWAYARAEAHLSPQEQRTRMRQRHDALLARLLGGQGKPLAPRPDQDKACIAAAEAAANHATSVEANPAFKTAARELGAHLEASLAHLAQDPPPRFNGMFYFRNQQNQSLAEAKFKTRTQNIRSQILGWMSQAKRVCLLGFDTGHLILAHGHLCPHDMLHAYDGCRWPNEKDKNAPLRARYVPAAAEWLKGVLPANHAVHAGKLWDAPPLPHGTEFDLVVICDPDHLTLRELEHIWPHLAQNALILIASERAHEAQNQTIRLQLQGRVYAPFHTAHAGSDTAHFCVMRPRFAMAAV